MVHPDVDTYLTELRIYYDKNGEIPLKIKDAITRVDGNHRLYHAKDFEDKIAGVR